MSQNNTDPPSNTGEKKSPLRSCVLLLTCSSFTFIVGGVLTYCYLSSQLSPPSTTSPADSHQEAPQTSSFTEELTPIQVSPVKPYGEKITEIRTLSKGFDFKSSLEIEQGATAAEERLKKNSYQADYTLTINEPEPATTAEQLSLADDKLTTMLPALTSMLEDATVNPYWQTLYRKKKKITADHSHHLLKLLTKHNFYDCNTILNLTHPETKRRALLIQADMDVVADGSDGDRLPHMPHNIVTSTHYQPTTSYSWAKTSNRVNPMITGYQQRIKNADKEIAEPATTKDRKNWLKSRKKTLQTTIGEMKKRSYLIAEHDPFIVLPVPVIVAKDQYSPNVGDYAVVFHDGRCYPAIVGDAGPDYKMGESSLRIAKEINSKSSPYLRPVSDLSVSYLVFPGTRKKPHRAPDYADIRDECLKLLSDIGGLRAENDLHTWEATLPPIVEPTLESHDTPISDQ